MSGKIIVEMRGNVMGETKFYKNRKKIGESHRKELPKISAIFTDEKISGYV